MLPAPPVNRCVLHLLLLTLGCSALAGRDEVDNSLAFPSHDSLQPSNQIGGSVMRPPTAPLIKLNSPVSGISVDGNEHLISFKDRHVNLTISSESSAQEKDWLLQTRLDTDFSEWSAPALRRSFEFTDLTEGIYRFEARTINPAGVAGGISQLVFAIQPPWYRTNWAYTGYALALASMLFALLRIRDRRSRVRHQELKKLAERLKALRKKNGYTNMYIFAYEHGFGRAQYGRYEKGQDLRFSTLVRLANCFEMDLKEFFREGFED